MLADITWVGGGGKRERRPKLYGTGHYFSTMGHLYSAETNNHTLHQSSAKQESNFSPNTTGDLNINFLDDTKE